ncbi:MAG: folate family ECF transporter S component [Oscillospiraceae bacterium]|nr:folate family ECF transporter S component [Oscillospiraceae bacterium]
MPENTVKKSNGVKRFFSPRRICAMAMLIALQIVLARFLGWQVSEGLRISFESIPVLIAGMWLGPVAGLIVGVISDVLGTIISGYGVYFVPLAITPIVNGVLPPLIFHYVLKDRVSTVWCVVVLVITQLIASMLLGTLALTWYYKLFVPNKDNAFAILFVARLTKLATIAADTVIVTILHFSMYKKVIRPMFAERRKA